MERKQVKSKSGSTTLVWGRMEAPVDFFKLTGDVAEAKFETKRTDAPAPVATDTTHSAPVHDVSDPLGPLELDPLSPTGHAMPDDRTGPAGEAPPPPPKPRRGITRLDGTWLDLTDQLEQITEATRLNEMRIVGFVARNKVPRERIVGSYYLAAGGPVAHRVLAALHYASHTGNRVALARWTKSTRQALGVIVPTPRALVVLELAFAANVREPNPRCMAHRAVELTEAERELALELVREMAVHSDTIDHMADDAITQRAALRQAAEEGLLDAWAMPAAERAEPIADVEEALRASL